MSYKLRTCANPRCHDVLERWSYVLCPSCALIGKVCFGVGALLAGVLMRLFVK